MLNAVIKLSLRHRPLVVVLCLVALLYGGYLGTVTPIDVFPDLDRPRVTVMTEVPGLAPEEVETLVTYPLESAMLGATGVQDVRTQSGFGLSVVTVEFAWGTDIKTARQTVQERLATVTGDMPEGVKPQMAPISSIMGQFLIAGMRRQPGPNGGDLVQVPDSPLYAERVAKGDGPPDLFAWKVTDRKNLAAWESVPVTGARWGERAADGEQRARATVGGRYYEVTFPSETQRALALRTLADWVVRPRLLKVSGVAQVITMGGGRKQYQVLVDPASLQKNGVTLRDVDVALRANNVNFTGGFADLGGVEQPVRVIGRLGPRPEQVVADLRLIVVKPPAKPEPGKGPDRAVLLKDVARVVEGAQIKRGDSSINGHPGVAITVTKQPHTDTRELSDRVKAAFAGVEPSLPADVVLEPGLYELREFIDRGVYNVGEALVIGAALVLVVLFLFLLNFRTTFISLSAIPLSLVITVLVFKLLGALTGTELSINVMTLGGIAVAMGELVDDAIVDVENIYRRLRENAHAPDPKPALRVVYEASAEIRSSIVFGTAVVILVFLPLFALSGVEGRLFTPLGVAYIVSILASLVVSLTVTPVLSYYLLAHSKAVHAETDGLLVRLLKWGAAGLVRLSMRRAALLLLFTWLMVAYCGWRVTTLGADFLPPFDEGTVQVGVTLPPGSSLEASNAVAKLVDGKLRSMQKSGARPDGEVLVFFRRTGRAELDEHAEPPNVNEYFVAINPASGKSRKEVIALLQSEVKEEVPGVDVEVEQPLAHLISHMISGSTAQIAIKVYGDDLDTLEKLANAIKASVGGIPGISSLAVEPIRKVDEIHIKLDPESLAFYGVDRAYVGAFVQTALNGEVVSQVVEGQRRFDLVVRLDEPYRADVGNLKELRLDLPNGGGQVRLKDLADVTPLTGGDSGANQVKRENVRRRIVIRCNAAGRDLASVVGDIERVVRSDVPMPEGYFVEYGGQFESQKRATRLIAALAALSVVGMFFVLYMLFPSPRVVLQILNAVPAAFIGGVLALVVTGQTLTVASLVGFISLGGIAARNGILLVNHYLHLMRHEGEGFTEHMILRGSLERLSPVLMTALTAGIGLIPLVVAGQQPGREILYPVATVILGGLITSTFCEFLLRPGLFWRFSGGDAVRLAGNESDADGLDDPPAASHEPHPPHGAAGAVSAAAPQGP
ncbi:Cobalt-zinc-cadmium resistance protein CzcA [Gemmata obscuriglobus]|uniref:CusA/CzcA family heavy metal efflux RND transporter n=1 Tax=Gemmata obscuriglobus TaxID=114 RepID=A0A2Z3H3D0_9BACT|nr:efflux RND transporter permease subunit [Gemmata obscuriglobus]AWM38227.1 CusA/CzcA family heavy metal efflux RND transporter [Gemmata obscuriglobus]QEG28870.1 Cobalt-zinc-cadmium resistance protein CzcA [Gemmata obscuriglobus]VTS07311.1 heavy metal efflux family : Heavy metal efflux pump, CzcA family OS=Rhodopirellula maiorica SM1 GN=RMSM_05477 PE=4 SV=1: ACR_tran: ACR_tran [Gemmata obscuriglobus UQM 2246]